MINLYETLQISPFADEYEIQNQLTQRQSELNAKVVKAVNDYLLVPNMRSRYDEKLKQLEPEFFARFASRGGDIGEYNQAQSGFGAAHETHLGLNNRLGNVDTHTDVRMTNTMPTNPYASPANYDNEEYEELPPLWNPVAAGMWSVLLNPVFGAILHAKNWEALDEPEMAKKNYLFAIIAVIVVTIITIVVPKTVTAMPIGLTIFWFFVLGRKQVEFFKEYIDEYEKRGWILPLVLTILMLGVWMALTVFVGEMLGFNMSGE